jgi:hypothetical protein
VVAFSTTLDEQPDRTDAYVLRQRFAHDVDGEQGDLDGGQGFNKINNLLQACL